MKKITKVIAAAAITVAALAMDPAVSHADTPHDAVLLCNRLSWNPTVPGLVAELNNMKAAGLTVQQAVDTLTLAFTNYCPQYRWILDSAIRTNGGTNTGEIGI